MKVFYREPDVGRLAGLGLRHESKRRLTPNVRHPTKPHPALKLQTRRSTHHKNNGIPGGGAR